MPTGIVQSFDESTGEGRIVQGGRHFACHTAQMAPSVRHAGAHVHFDISADHAVAVNVEPRPGGRSNGNRRKTGVSGPFSVAARVGGTPSAADDEVRRVVKPTNMHVARWWAAALAEGSLDEVLAVYAPQAVVHLDGRELTGRRHLSSAIEALAVHGAGRGPDTVRGDSDGETVVVAWAATPDGGPVTSRSRVVNGEIAEQWIETIDGALEAAAVAEPQFPIQLVTRGRVSRRNEEKVVDKLLASVHLVVEPILFARAKLTQLADPAARRPALAEAALDVNGELIRAQVSADTMTDAIDLLERRLQDRLRHHHERREWVRPAEVKPRAGEWRHGNQPTEHPPFFERPVDEREIIRHKAWGEAEISTDEAVFDLEALDHDFHLFRELATGQDSCLTRVEPGRYRLQQVDPHPDATAHTASVVEFDPRSAPELSVAAAVERMDVSGDPCVFFRNESTGRGTLLYRRFDGHYGLVTPDN